MIPPPPRSTLFPYTTLFRSVPDKPGVAARIFKTLGDAAINVDMIVQNISHGTGAPATDLSFTVDKARSEEHTSELQSLTNLVCRLLLEKKKHTKTNIYNRHK